MRDLTTVAFVISHACPLKCDFCCSTADVVGGGRLDRAAMACTMIAFGADRRVVRFAFTGGDPYLYIADIRAALEEARAAGIGQPFEINTSAYWVKDAEQTRAVLAELQALGLSIVSLSYDHEHARWVTRDQILTVCRVARGLGLQVLVFGTFWEQDESLDQLLPELREIPGVERHEEFVAPIGRATLTFHRRKRYHAAPSTKASCGRPGFYSLAIYPDGEVYPCCSGGFNVSAKLSCGNINRHAPSTIIYNAFANFHVRLVKEYGWPVLYELVAREAPALLPRLPRVEAVDSCCEICRDINLTLKEELAPIYTAIEREYARVRAEFEWRDRSAGDGWSGRRLVGEQHLTAMEFDALIATDRGTRLDYLAGALQIGDPPPSA